MTLFSRLVAATLLAPTLLAVACGDDDDGPPVDRGADAAPPSDGAPLRDAGGADGGSSDAAPDPFAACAPGFDPAPPADGGAALTAGAGAVYCTAPDESLTLKELLALRAKLKIFPGRHSLPAPPTTNAAFALPVCLLDASGVTAAGAGTVTYKAERLETLLRHDLVAEQPLAAAGGRAASVLRLQLYATSPPPAVLTPRLEGGRSDLSSDDSGMYLWLCPKPGCAPPGVERRFDSCAFEGVPTDKHRLTFTAGELELDLRIDRSGITAGTEPSAFVRASGTYKGVAFDQRDPSKLVYLPGHHHFTRRFAVLFDAPIGGACGLEIGNLESMDNVMSDEAFTVSCALDRLGALTITRAAFTPGR